MNNNLIFHYIPVIHNTKEGIYLHEAFSTKSGQLYMLNPIPAEVSGETEEEIDFTLKAMDKDSIKYSPVHIGSAIEEIERWTDEVDVQYEFVEPIYEDEDYDALDDHLDSSGEVIDICAYFERNKHG